MNPGVGWCAIYCCWATSSLSSIFVIMWSSLWYLEWRDSVFVNMSFTVILFGEKKMSWVWSFSRFVCGGGGDLNIENSVLCPHSWLCLIVFLCCEDGWIDGSGMHRTWSTRRYEVFIWFWFLIFCLKEALWNWEAGKGKGNRTGIEHVFRLSPW